MMAERSVDCSAEKRAVVMAALTVAPRVVMWAAQSELLKVVLKAAHLEDWLAAMKAVLLAVSTAVR
jgi:hypothetical protein